MHEIVYGLMRRLCALVEPVPVGTNLGLVMVFWMLVTGQLLGTRGAVVPALSATGLAPPAVRRAWASLGHGAWTTDTLRLIQSKPAVRAGDLAADLNRETPAFKLDVRKLKNLGLTYSLETGYELSPRGAAYLATV